ncbi:MAG: hypothetical protein M3Q19_15030 [Pseudomonadota bacterium]|nr:hypothetical protein [Pseudomonadota bacterium]
MNGNAQAISADNDRRQLRCWHEWEIDGNLRRVVLCIETGLEMRPGEPGFDPLALESLVAEAHELMRSCPSPIDSIRIVPAR